MYLNIGFVIILVYCSIRINLNHFTEAVSYDKSNVMKGLMALVIVLHHLALAGNMSGPGLVLLKYIAFPLVSGFFFYSGFGLVKSYLKNGRQIILKSFVAKRISRLMTPYIIVIFSFGLYQYFQDSVNFVLGNYLADIFLARKIGPLWYMTVLVFLYALFAICFKYFDAVVARRIILTATLIYISICIAFSVPSQWYSSIIGFYIGILYGMNEAGVNRFLNKRYYVKFFLLWGTFMVLFCFRLIVSLWITDSEILHGPFRNVIDLFFIFSLISLSKIIEIKNNALRFIGKISYEIYLVHPFIIYILRDRIWSNAKYTIIIFVISLGLAWLLHEVNKSIQELRKY